MGKSKKHSSIKSRLSNSSLSNLFNLNKKRKRDDESATDDSAKQQGGDGEMKAAKRLRRSEPNAEQKRFEELERKYEAELPAELRKYRPKGYRFNLPPEDRPIRVYADGVFDLFHLGHMKQLEQCKKALPNVVLICGVPNDEITHKLKGLTVLTDEQRCETLRHCKWVDEVVPNAPWCVTAEFLAEHNIDYVAHDDLPYVGADSDDIYKPIKEMGRFLATQRTSGISTSDIITRIIRNYDKYLMRNFARGATRQELNVSWLKKNELDFKKHVDDFRSYFKKNQHNLNNVSKDLYFEVREILLRKTLGKKLYSKLVGQGLGQDLKKRLQHDRRLIREKSPVSEFASKFTGEPSEQDPHCQTSQNEEDDEGASIDSQTASSSDDNRSQNVQNE
ncbi:hypothetical protein HG536_0E05020 [Torulaspora globosa]|uniref:choline-phosphate cytidylyltransferase n=1 Tax=Torulaspora globosa TaxID=48254 RepID=A0A7G3ZJA5_9SACH|nr:uncharacterized protein HG536_0E05020 [Torulaspora globosa]QLL33591.1 hypothetical protein HG536_0E05020 [Torulaspora globosa]